MIDIFLSTNEQAKINLIKYLHFSHFSCSIEEASIYLDVSSRTIERYIEDLKSDFEQTFPNQEVSIEKNRGTVNVTFNQDISINHLIDRLRLNYIEVSSEFEIIQLLLTKKFTNVFDLAEELYQSSSSIYKYLERIKVLFKAFDIELSFSSADKLNLLYDEMNMRFFLYYYYWVTIKGIEQPFPERLQSVIELEEPMLANEANLLPSKQKQVNYLVAITFTRLIDEKHYVKLNEDTKRILLAFSSQHDLSTDYKQSFDSIVKEHQLDEHLFFNFLLRAIVSELDNDQQKMLIVAELKTLDSPTIQFIIELFGAVAKKFDLYIPIDEEDIIIYYATIFFLFIFLFEISPPMHLFRTTFSSSNPIDIERAEIILAFYHSFLKNQQLTTDVDHDYFIVLVINYLLSFNKPKPINIAIQFSKNIIGEATTRERLKFMFNHELLNFTTNYKEAEIIISDSFESDDFPDTQHILIEQLTDELIWGKLFQEVQKKIFDKNTQVMDPTANFKMKKA